METTKQIVADYNKKLFEKLFPNKSEPISCNSVTDPSDPILNMSFAEIAQNHLKEILDVYEFDTELEQIKHDLKID